MATNSFLNKLIHGVLVTIEDAIERFGDPSTRQIMYEAMIKARDRASELAIENAALEDRVDALTARLNDVDESGGALFKDEVDAINAVIELPGDYDRDVLKCIDPKVRAVLTNLLKRTVHVSMTEKEWRQHLSDAIYGVKMPSSKTESARPSKSYCNCDRFFHTAEDYRDHLNVNCPCDSCK